MKDWQMKKPSHKYEIAGEAKSGRFHETYYREDDARDRAKEVVDDLFEALDNDIRDVGSITIRKSENHDD